MRKKKVNQQITVKVFYLKNPRFEYFEIPVDNTPVSIATYAKAFNARVRDGQGNITEYENGAIPILPKGRYKILVGEVSPQYTDETAVSITI